MKYVINGKFLAEKITGIQRYAYELTRELDAMAEGRDIELFVPSDATADLSVYHHIKLVPSGKPAGERWEQFTYGNYLRRHGAQGINLCNIVPLCCPRGIACIHDINYRVMPEAVATALATSYASTLSFIGEEVAVTRGIASADITINNVVNEGNGRLALTVTPSGMTTGQGYAFALVMNDGTSMYSTSYTSVFYAIPPVAIGIAADGILAGKGNVNVGSTVRLIALLVPTDTNLKGVQWTSSDETVATVDANGLVTAHGNGTATITVTSTADQTVSKSIAITVSDGVITLNTDDLVSQSSAE